MSRRGTLVAIALGLLSVVVAAVVIVALVRERDTMSGTAEPTVIDGIESRSVDRANPPQRDLEPGLGCSVEIGQLKAGGRVTNHSPKTSTYSLLVAWEDNGVRIADATTIIESIAPGATARWDVTGLGKGNIDTACRVVRIDRVNA